LAPLLYILFVHEDVAWLHDCCTPPTRLGVR